MTGATMMTGTQAMAAAMVTTSTPFTPGRALAVGLDPAMPHPGPVTGGPVTLASTPTLCIRPGDCPCMMAGAFMLLAVTAAEWARCPIRRMPDGSDGRIRA